MLLKIELSFIRKSTTHESKSSKSITLDVQLKLFDEELEVGNFDEHDGTWPTTTKTSLEEESERKKDNYNTSLSSTILITSELLSHHNTM